MIKAVTDVRYGTPPGGGVFTLAQNRSVRTVPQVGGGGVSSIPMHRNGLLLTSKNFFPRGFMAQWLPLHACHTTSHYHAL